MLSQRAKPPRRTLASRLNIEKGVFALSAIWLLAMGVRLSTLPASPTWGPPRTFERPSEPAPVIWGSVPPDVERNPFVEDNESTPAVQQQPQESLDQSNSGEHVSDGGSELSHEEADDEGGSTIGTSSSDETAPQPPRFVGTISVEDSGTYTLVSDAEGYVTFAPQGGEAGRYRLIERAAGRLVLEDTDGRRLLVTVP